MTVDIMLAGCIVWLVQLKSNISSPYRAEAISALIAAANHKDSRKWKALWGGCTCKKHDNSSDSC